jgi:hypothetical protein
MGKNTYVRFIPSLSLIYGLEIKCFSVNWSVNYEQSERELILCVFYVVGNLLASLFPTNFENFCQLKAVACLSSSWTSC